MTWGSQPWNLEKHIEELREWETSITISRFYPVPTQTLFIARRPQDVDKKKSTTVHNSEISLNSLLSFATN